MDLAKRKKKAIWKDLRDVDWILKKVEERENKVIFGKVSRNEDLCVIGVTDTSYNQKDHSIGEGMILLGSRTTKIASSMYWNWGVIIVGCVFFPSSSYKHIEIICCIPLLHNPKLNRWTDGIAWHVMVFQLVSCCHYGQGQYLYLKTDFLPC